MKTRHKLLTYQRLSEIGVDATPDSWCGNAGHTIGMSHAGQFVTAGDVITELMDQREELLAIAQKVFNDINGLNATARAVDGDYRGSPLEVALSDLVRLAANAVHKATGKPC